MFIPYQTGIFKILILIILKKILFSKTCINFYIKTCITMNSNGLKNES